MDEQDQDLLARYRKGDLEALDRLVEKHRRPLFGYIVKMTEGRDDADDIFQEVWLRAIRNQDRFKSGNFCGWLMRIARNLVIDRVRKRKPIVNLVRDKDDEDPFESRVADPGLSPSSISAAGELGIRIDVAVAELPAEQREVFVMRMQGDVSFKEIAEIQGVSINTALARMQYAVRKLRAVLQTDYEELERA